VHVLVAAETTTKDIEPLVPVLVAALVYAALWVLVAGAVFAARRPVEPDEGPSTQELGPEPPAVANLLTGVFEVTSEAIPATLLDLGARRLLEFETLPDESTLVRLSRRTDRSALNDYERRVYGLVKDRAVNGVVPATALTTGEAGEVAKGWWKGFRKEVIADAQSRGQCVPVWSKGISAVLGLAALFPWFLLWASGKFNEPEDVETTPLMLVVIGVAIVLTFIGARIAASDRQRGTRDGMEAGSRWLGVRAYIGETVTFPDLPPAHVLLWDRYLAYAAAFGVARECIRVLPMGAELDRRAWSSYGGAWRQVKVRYGRLSRPGWGLSPPMAILRGLFFGGIAAGAAYALLVNVDPLDAINDADAVTRYLGWGALALGVVVLLLAFRFAYMVGAGSYDAFVTTTVEGEILRERTRSGNNDKVVHWVAVDTGKLPKVHAWKVTPARAAEVAQHQVVRARVTPLLGFVRSFERLPVTSN
jgi:hypothetical protein